MPDPTSLSSPIHLGTGINERILAQLPVRAQRISESLAAASRQVLTGARSGRVYSRGGRSWQASRPGEPPAVASGILSTSFAPSTSGLQWGPRGYQVTSSIHSEVPYAARFDPALPGYNPGARPVAPRPFVGPILNAARAPIMTIVHDRWLA